MQTDSTQPASIIWRNETGNVLFLKSFGDWTNNALALVPQQLNQLRKKHTLSIQWDVSQINSIDSSGMLLFINFYDFLKSNHCDIEIIGATEEHEKLYALLRKYAEPSDDSRKLLSGNLLKPFTDIGKKSVKFAITFLAFLDFIGENFVIFLHSITHPGTIRWDAIVKNVEDAGLRALPIIALTSFLIGVVIAYQGAVQLEKFGANIFVVDMICISITRELAPLITAIVVAGRTGSSYTAQLGVMIITEEIDAMRTMGFEPHRFLVLPRILALMLVLPLLIFFADIIGIIAGMFISNIHLNLSYGEFTHRLQNVLELKHVWIGIGKGPFFAWLIAAVSCFQGFQVSKNTESIGRYTTISVVNAIFLVIACDAIFSVLLTELGI